MSLESVKSLFEKAGINPASNIVPKIHGETIAPSAECPQIHPESLRHFRIVLDHSACPTKQYCLWYDGHLGIQGGVSSLLMTEEMLAQHRQKIARFAHEEIAAFNIAQIDTGLAVIAYLKETALAQQCAVIAVPEPQQASQGDSVMNGVVTSAHASGHQPTEQHFIM